MKAAVLVCLLVQVARGFVAPSRRARAARGAAPRPLAAAAAPGGEDPFDDLLAAAAALLSLSMIGAWVANPGPVYTEPELARLELEVERALRRIGLILHETDRLTASGLDRSHDDE